jgi:hypothetical protein
MYLRVEAFSVLGEGEGDKEVPETKTQKPSRSARDRDFEDLLRVASRRLSSPKLKSKPVQGGRRRVRTSTLAR